MNNSFTGEPKAVASLAKKIAAILGEIENVPKKGFNAFHKYPFVREADLADAVRKQLAKHGVAMFTGVESVSMEKTVTETGKEGFLTTVRTSHTFVCSETGATFTVGGAGQGNDRLDKGIYKAITGAMKYALYKVFLVSTNDDPEQENPDDQDNRPPERQQRRESTPPKEEQKKAEPGPMPTNRMPSGVKWQDIKVHYGPMGPKEFGGKDADFPEGRPLGKMRDEQLAYFLRTYKVAPRSDGQWYDEDVVFHEALQLAAKDNPAAVELSKNPPAPKK